jgi:urease
MPTEEMFPIPEEPKGYLAGAVICKKEKIKFNVGRKRWAVEVKNAGDRPIQVRACSITLEFQLTE